MKKLLSLLMVLCSVIGASAQNNWTARTGQSQDRTVVIADFSVTNGAVAYEGNWQIGVFVGDECRLVTNDGVNGALKTEYNEQFLVLEIPGNFDAENDEGKPIVIKVMSTMADVYTLTPTFNDQPLTLTWKPDTYGKGSGPRVQLNLTLPASVTLDMFAIEAGDHVDLKDCITPADAQLPDNLKWYIGDSYFEPGDYSQYATLNGSTMYALQPYLIGGVNQPIPYGVVIDGGNYTPLIINGQPVANSSFYIERRAQSLNIVTNTITVIKYGAEDLTMFMRNQTNDKAYTTDPNQITEEVKWEIEDPTYIEESQGTWTPIKGGTTRIRPYIQHGHDSYLYPENDQWITVNIIVPVEGAELQGWPVDPQTQRYVTFKANVGDENIYQRLASFVKIYPDDVSDDGFTMLNVSQIQGVINVNDDAKTIQALKAGTATVMIQPTGLNGWDYPINIVIEVFDPLKEVSFTENPLFFSMGANTTIASVTAGIRQNIIWQQTDKTIQEGTITVAGALNGTGSITANGPMLTLTNNEVPTGESTVTVTVGWNDYSNYVGTEASIIKLTNNGQTFTVKITQELDHFAITVEPDDVDPNRGVITLTPVPADAEFDWANYQNILNIESLNYDASWHVIDMKGANGNYTYFAILPGTYRVTCSNDPGVTFEAPARVTFETGWQWKSNPYGNVSSNKDLMAFFNYDNLAEARTQNELLYNDPQWSYWGSLYDIQGIAIAQSQMYKVNMKNVAQTYARFGQPAENNAYPVSQGWNWIGSPYFYKRTLENAVMNPVEGMVIVGKTASSEYSGNAWSGDLKTIDPGQGYYVYLPGELESGNFVLACEVYGMTQGDDTPAGARSARRHVWNYDHTQFASNMTMVAEISDLDNAEDYSIGAFVGDECRGEGIIEDGRAFITVHTNAGEQVSFRLYNELTGEMFDIEQTVRSGAMRLGSLKAPVQLTTHAVTTGIQSVDNDQWTMDNYDLGGRRVNATTKGLTIQRKADGTVRKVGQ